MNIESSNGWIRCSEKLPPKGVWVKFRKYPRGDVFIVKRSGLFGRGYWKYKSGLSDWYLSGSDEWTSLTSVDLLGERLKEKMEASK